LSTTTGCRCGALGPGDPLPDDIDALRAVALRALEERDRAIGERDLAIELNDRLRRLLRQANNALYGSRSERLSKLPAEQLALALEDIEQALAKSEAEEDKAGGTAHAVREGGRKTNRGALPAHLPRLHHTILPDDTDCPCCRAPMQIIGEETAERLDVIPAHYRVIVTHRPRLVCRPCEKIAQAPAPEHLIRSGLPSEALVASVLVSKYGWHLPLYRQAKMMTAQGIDLDRSTLAYWIGLRGSRVDAALPAAQADAARFRQAGGRRNAGAGARPGARQDQDGILLDDGPR